MIIRLLRTCFLIQVFSFSVLANDKSPVVSAYPLPVDLKQVVLSFEIGSDLQTPNRQLNISADGTLSIWGAHAPLQAHHLTADQLQQLLDFVIRDRHFLAVHADQIQQQIKSLQQSGRLFAITDAPTSRIRVNLPKQQHRVEFYAVDMAARLFPEIAELQDLQAIHTRLNELFETVP